jgi:uncharacterized membrane protein (DUF441 family)
MFMLLTPLANGFVETKDFSERYGIGVGICALLGGIVIALFAGAESRYEGFTFGAFGGGILGALATTGGAF